MALYRQRVHFVHLLLLLLLHLAFRLRRAAAASIAIEFLHPNFTGSSVNFIDNGGIFLISTASAFSAILTSDAPQAPFVFSILHTPTSTVVWSANSAAPAPYTSVLSLTSAGLSILLSNGSLLWSTPTLSRQVASLQLLNSGNLLLRDSANKSLWQSFEHPTDTILSSQQLPVGAFLSTTAGDYRLQVTVEDALLLWAGGGQQYWRLSADARSVKELNDPVAYMAANNSGLYLFSVTGQASYIVDLPETNLRFVRLESGGQLQIMGYSGNGSDLSQEFSAPTGACDLPLSCNELQVCTTQSTGATCNCLASFTATPTGGCSPDDNSTMFSLSDCDRSGGARKSEPSYKSLGSQAQYFANKFAIPERSEGNSSSCRSLCTENCSCLGFFYQNSSKSCFLIKTQFGSLLSSSNEGVFNSGDGYIKVLAFAHPNQQDLAKSSKLIEILLPSIAGLLLFLLFAGFYWARRRQGIDKNKPAPLKEIRLGRSKHWLAPSGGDGSDGDISKSSENENSGEISIPGLPQMFTYAELLAATNNFSSKIGSGGFGEVFFGELRDNTSIAVKRINAGIGSLQGKKEFCTEIAVIGSIHHVNLVRLRGFCAEGRRRRLLVYEYMNRGSLDCSLFRAAGPVLEWQERMDIAIGAARGLAYLHTGCDRKIVHCDVKPENILLDDGRGVKISDFGLAKLIAPERSGLFFTTMRGTRGYLAPEWLLNSAISERVDVYSYGMVLLEIIRGRKNGSEGGGSEGWWSGTSGEAATEYFPSRALEMHEKGTYLGLEDPRLEGRVREEEVGRAVRVALCCLHEEPSLRPSMAAVVAMLDGAMEAAWPHPEALTFFRQYGRGFIGSSNSGDGANRVAAETVSWSQFSRQKLSLGGGGKAFSSLQ